MTGKELFAQMGRNEIPSRIPFVPTVYEHAASLIGKSPSQVAQSSDLIVEGQLAAYRLYKHDLIAVGVDIYNIEVEALGAGVHYYANNDLPSIDDILVNDPEDLKGMKLPDPEKDGRMPMIVEATAKIAEEVGKEVAVNGAIVGPFTLACILRGFENFVMDLMVEPEFALELMHFARKTGLAFAGSFIKRGLGISINESWIAPPLLSPALYKEHVFQVEKQLIQEIKALGQQNVALISGGNTTQIVPQMLETGTSLLMADYQTDRLYFKELCSRHGACLRASIQPKTVQMGTERQMLEETRKVVEACGSYPKFLFGCGIVSYDTPPEKLLLLQRLLNGIKRT